MPTSTQDSLSGERRSACGGDVSPVRHPPLYDVSTFIRNFLSYFDKQQFFMIPTSGFALSVIFGPGNGDTTVDVWLMR